MRAGPIASQNRAFSKSRRVGFRTTFGSVLGPQKRPKTVPKRGSQRVQRPVPFCNRFLTDSRSSETRKSFKNLRKIDDFAKLGFALPSRKNVNFGSIFGLTSRRNSINTEVRKWMKNQTLYGRHFCQFWRPRPPPKSSKNGQKIVRSAFCGHLGRKPELGQSRSGDSHPGLGGLKPGLAGLKLLRNKTFEELTLQTRANLHKPSNRF